MKKWLSVFSAVMVRPMLYQAMRRGIIAATALLLWNRFISGGGSNGLVNGAFVAGMIFLLLAWSKYLSMDGLTFHYMLEEKKAPKKKRHFTRDMVDFVDEHVTNFDELSEDEQKLCSFLSSLILTIVFFLLSFLASLF